MWGALHGAYLAANHAWRLAVPRWGGGRLGSLVSWGGTFAAVVIAWVFFRAADMDTAVGVLGAMFGAEGFSVSGRLQGIAPVAAVGGDWLRFDGFFANGLVDWRWGLALVAGAGMLAVLGPNTMEVARTYRPVLGLAEHGVVQSRLKWRPILGWAIVTGVLFGACVIKISGDSPFLYFQF